MGNNGRVSERRPRDEYAEIEKALLARWPETRIDPTLDRIAALMDLLGNPQRAYPVIHVAGTNGKGSTARMIEELLRELNLRTGRYSSPHLQSMTERIVLDAEPISTDRFVATYREIEPFLDLVDSDLDVPLSYFETITAMGFAAFADAPVDVAIVEVGLGGRWDATNVADGQVAVVTPVSLDHSEYLGDTVELIAGEKAGIIKPGAMAVLAAQPPSAAEVLIRRIAETGATGAREGVEFGVRRREMAVGGQVLDLQGVAAEYDEIFVPLYGAHQAQNAATAVAAVEAFVGGGREALDVDAVRNALGRATAPGRIEVLRRGPVIIADAAHNPAGAGALAAALEEDFASTVLVAVVAVAADKDVEGILAELSGAVEAVVCTTNSSARSLPVADLARVAERVFDEEKVFRADTLPDAIDLGLAIAERDATFGGFGVIVTGSVVTAGDARTAVGLPVSHGGPTGAGT